MLLLLVIILLSLLILGHEAGHFMAAKFFRMKVDEFGFGFPPRLAAKKKGETTYSLNWLPFGGFVKIAGEQDQFDDHSPEQITQMSAQEKSRLFSAFSPSKRAVVILAGVFTNFLLGLLIFIPVFMTSTEAMLVVAQIQPDSPAVSAGIKEGDIVKNFTSSQSFIDFINQHRGQPVSIEIRRGKKDLTIIATPREKTDPGQGALGVVPVYVAAGEGQNIFRATGSAFTATFDTIRNTFAGLGNLVRQIVLSGSLPRDIAGPVGIVSFAQKTAQVGFVFLLNLVAIISINLGVMNLLPFPALDGGRFALIIVEKIKGSPLSRTVELWINGIGFAILLTLMVLVTIHDISAWF